MSQPPADAQWMHLIIISSPYLPAHHCRASLSSSDVSSYQQPISTAPSFAVLAGLSWCFLTSSPSFRHSETFAQIILLSISSVLISLTTSSRESTHHRLGMDTIKIPSPSTILDSSDPLPVSKRAKPASPPKRSKQIASASPKPKQTKSRNGTISSLDRNTSRFP